MTSSTQFNTIYDLINTGQIQSQYISSIQGKSEAVFYQINILCYLCQLLDPLKWCQKWDLNGKFFLIMFNIDNSFMFDVNDLIYYYLNLNSINLSHHNTPNPNKISNLLP